MRLISRCSVHLSLSSVEGQPFFPPFERKIYQKKVGQEGVINTLFLLCRPMLIESSERE